MSNIRLDMTDLLNLDWFANGFDMRFPGAGKEPAGANDLKPITPMPLKRRADAQTQPVLLNPETQHEQTSRLAEL
jgi:hypothetical protein